MASYNELNALIDAYINRNGVQAITGQILNGVLKAMVEQLGRGYTIMGVATPTTDPGTPDGPECYFASETGTYTDFDGLQVVPGELALLCYTPTDGWTKATIYEGFQEVQATIDGNVGTPSVGVSYANGVLSFDFHNMKGNPGQDGQDGQDGDPAGFGTIGADITGGVGTPGVTVESSGPATAKNLQFHFTNLKGETGVTSVVATVDNTTGNPSCTVSLNAGVLTLAFTGLKGAQGDTGSSVAYPFTIVNNLTTDDATQALSAAQGVVLQGEITQLELEVDELDKELITGTRTLNNIRVATGGKITFNAITLSQDGDELYFEALPDSSHNSQNNGGYPFTFGSPEDAIRVGLPYTALCVRADDNTWIYGPVGSIGDVTGYNPKKVKIKYTGGNIEIYGMDMVTPRATYTGQKTVTIYGIGSQTMTSYGKWSGTIWRFAYTHNGVTTELTDLPGYTKNEYVTENYDETDGRVPALESAVAQLEAEVYALSADAKPKFVVNSSSTQVNVFQKIHGNFYIRLSINHYTNLADTSYVDYWRIGHNSSTAQTGEFYTYENGSFTSLSKYPLNYAENEFAIQFYTNDFTGGTHGNERIDLDPACYIVFIVDGKEYTIGELNALGTITCNSFSYREKSFLYSMYSITGTHDKIAEHIKITEFKDGGYVTNNHIKMVAALTARTAYSGLVCIYKDCSDYVVDDNGTVFTMSHPSSAVQVSAYKNDTNYKTRMFKGNLSCHFDSRVVGGNVASYKNANPNVTIWDRQGDTKYYAMMPTSVSLSVNDVFEFECTAKWDYRETE